MNNDLQGKTALVTGGASGIGKAVALLYGQYGAKVMVSDLDETQGQAVVAQIEAAGGQARFFRADVGDAAQCRQLVQETVSVFGSLDVACNNAGITGEMSLTADMSLEGWQQIINVNLNSVFFCLKYELEVMLKQGHGSIINMSSILGQVGTPTLAGYVTAKHGVVAMSHTINMEECVNGIRSSVVLPGEVATPILDKRPVPVTKEERAKMAQSEDVGDLIRYIACLPPHIVINEVMINPTWNRSYVAALQRAKG